MEELKGFIGILKDMPDMVIWLVAFYFFFKIVVVGSIYKVVALAIVKVHDMVVAKKVNIIDNSIKLDGEIISSDATQSKFKKLVKLIKFDSSYVHDNGIEFAMDAIEERMKTHNKYRREV